MAIAAHQLARLTTISPSDGDWGVTLFLLGLVGPVPLLLVISVLACLGRTLTAPVDALCIDHTVLLPGEPWRVESRCDPS